jgi:hypothetical protein
MAINNTFGRLERFELNCPEVLVQAGSITAAVLAAVSLRKSRRFIVRGI